MTAEWGQVNEEVSDEPTRRRICALVAYDGTAFCGFQYQDHSPSIQQALEAALDACGQRLNRVVGAGRTDTGVHASGQVVCVDMAWRHPLAKLERAWNAHLPDAIVVRNVCEGVERFHPRFSAVNRTYRYTVVQAPSKGRWWRRSPLTDRFAHYEARPLDLQAMQLAAGHLLGRHDFATFGLPPKGERTERIVTQAEWQRVADTLPPLSDYPGERLVFTVTANSFLRNMVRNLVGALLQVGRGEWTADELAAALAACDRGRSAPPAPPQGLVLENVTYPALLDPFGS